MELAAGKRHDQPGCLIMAGISSVFTIARVAELLGKDDDWLHELSMGLDSEDGCLWVYDINGREVQAFTR
jgi:hypothetical protein